MSATPQPDDPLSALDFEPRPMACEVIKQPWTHTKRATTLWGATIVTNAPFEKVPFYGPCDKPATHVVDWRVCPCIANVAQWNREHPDMVETHSPITVAGLVVVKTSMCDDHVEYFIDYLTYPFACPQCGVAFESPREVLLSGVVINEQG